jgi:hypothetical protein
MGLAADTEILRAMQIEGPTDFIGPVVVDSTDMEDASDSPADKKRSDHAQTTRDTHPDRRLRDEPMLFGDDGGNCTLGTRKPHHRIRAHRKSAKKRTGDRIEGQGTLFELDGFGQSAA